MTTCAETVRARGPAGEILMEGCDLHFAYSGNAPVICGASLQLRRGSMSALIGANGSGKSTLIRLLTGLVLPACGQIKLCGVELPRIPKRELARKVAYVPQGSDMVFPFTALEMVLTGRSPYTTGYGFESEKDCEKAREAMAAVGVLHLAPRSVMELSGGERQLVSVARALAQQPACLLLDEPSAALDLKHRAGLIRLLRRLRDEQGLTALVVTHDLQLLDPAFDHVFAMRCGKVVAEGRPQAVLCREVLANIYDDPNVQALRLEGRTFVWSEF